MLKLEERQILRREDLTQIYNSGIKKQKDFAIGMEYERIVISKSSYKNVDYWADYGIKNFLEEFAYINNWDFIMEGKNPIGLKKLHDTITLEPGAQVELSIKPEKSIFDLKAKIDKITQDMELILSKYNLQFLNYGISPYSTYKSINLIPKKRYKTMAKYLWGILAHSMMRESAGVQCCIDFSSEEDAMRKFKLANKLSPIMCAMFANSPIRGGVDTGYKSFRALTWLNTDNDRCGFCGKISEEFSFDEYIDCVLKVPMIFITRDNSIIEINGNITFGEFLQNGYEGIYPIMDDYLLHANLFFPEVRIRNFIEIRNHDCVGANLQYSIPAIYKGIMYNDCAMDECEDLLKHLQYKDFSQMRYDVPKLGLQTKIKKTIICDYAKEIIGIAQKYLKQFNLGEEIFLEPISEFVSRKASPSDIIIANWKDNWNKELRYLIEYVSSFE